MITYSRKFGVYYSYSVIQPNKNMVLILTITYLWVWLQGTYIQVQTHIHTIGTKILTTLVIVDPYLDLPNCQNYSLRQELFVPQVCPKRFIHILYCYPVHYTV